MSRPHARLVLLIATILWALPSPARAQQPALTPPEEPTSTPSAKEATADVAVWPRLGGHFGVALPFVNFTSDGTTAIGRDFIQVGVTPGVTVKLDEHWAVDFEFIGFGIWERHEGEPDVSRTVLVVDPGVVYNFGPVAAGLRLAVGVGDPMNYGLVPIAVLPIPITEALSYFLELDFPIFVTAIAGKPAEGEVPATEDRAIGSFGIQLQTGFSF